MEAHPLPWGQKGARCPGNVAPDHAGSLHPRVLRCLPARAARGCLWHGGRRRRPGAGSADAWAASSALWAPRARSAPGRGLRQGRGDAAARPVQGFRHSGERTRASPSHAYGGTSRPNGGGPGCAVGRCRDGCTGGSLPWGWWVLRELSWCRSVVRGTPCRCSIAGRGFRRCRLVRRPSRRCPDVRQLSRRCSALGHVSRRRFGARRPSRHCRPVRPASGCCPGAHGLPTAVHASFPFVPWLRGAASPVPGLRRRTAGLPEG